MGFPIHRSRVVIVGIAKGFTTPDAMVNNFKKLIYSPMQCDDWRAFLGRDPGPKYELSCIGVLSATAEEGVDVCTCSVDPYHICATHPCYCQVCSSGKKVDNCEWRKTHIKYIQKHIGENDVDTWVANTCKLMSYLG